MSKVVLITGAQAGTGFGIARYFAQQGWNVFITSRSSTDMSKNVTGTELIVDGGMSCQLLPCVLNEL